MRPIGWDQLREYQKQGAVDLSSDTIRGLWYAAGVGKTATILAALELTEKYPALIITRTIGRGAWHRDAKWLLGPDKVPGMLFGTKPYPDPVGKHRGQGFYSSISKLMAERQILVMHYDIVRHRIKELLNYHWKTLILDEAHLIKGGYQQQKVKRDGTTHVDIFRHVQTLAQSVRNWGGRVWELTATPIKDRPRDLWAQIELVAPRSVGTAWQFLHKYCGAYQGPYGLVTTGSSNEEELESILQKHFSKLTRAEIASQLPAVQFSIDEIQADYKNVKQFGGSIEASVAAACEMKLESATELIPEYLNSRCKVLVTVSRRRFVPVVLEYFEKHLFQQIARPVREELWTFGVSGAIEPIKRMEILNEFNDREKPALGVATIDCLSESINLHKIEAAIVMGLPYTPGLLDQFCGRFGRLGGLPCTIHFLVAQGTIDERIRELLLDKLEKVKVLHTDTAHGETALNVLKSMRNEEEVIASLRDWLTAEGQ